MPSGMARAPAAPAARALVLPSRRFRTGVPTPARTKGAEHEARYRNRGAGAGARHRGVPGRRARQGGSHRRAVELLDRGARPRPRGPRGQVLHVADVRLPRGRDAGRPALAGRRTGDALGTLVRSPALDLPSAQGRQVPHRRRGDVRGREVQPAARHRQALDDRLRRPAARAHRGHRDAGARPARHRHQGSDADHPHVSLALALHRGHDLAEEVHRVRRRRRVRAEAGGQRALPVRRAGDGLAHQAGCGRQPLAHRRAALQDRHLQAGPGGDDADRAPASRRGRHRRREPRAGQGARARGVSDSLPPGRSHPDDVVGPAARRSAHEGQARARGAEPGGRPHRDRAVDLRRPRRSRIRAHGALVVVSRHRLQGVARDAVPVRSGAGQEAPRRRRSLPAASR
jgi:hypothetical protein